MNDEQIKHMVNRFLAWKLPANFNPDAGITFTPEFNVEWNAKHGNPPQRHEPTGTNLFDYTQAEAMVRHMLEGLPAMTKATGSSELVERLRGRAKAQPLLAALQRAVAIVDPVMAATMYAADPDPKIETLLDALDIEYAALIRAETTDLEARLARAEEALGRIADSIPPYHGARAQAIALDALQENDRG